MAKSTFWAAVAFAALLAGGVAERAQAVETFTVNPGAVGIVGIDPFVANYIDFSYTALVDQIAAGGVGTFTEEGGGFFSSFRYPDLNTGVLGTGLLNDYQLYLTFSASGTVSPDGSGGLFVTFTSFTGQIWLDPLATQTVINVDGTGGSDGTVSFSNTADDILVGQTTGLILGEAHVFASLAAGDFDVVAAFQPVGGFFSGTLFLGLVAIDVNGVNTTLAGFSTGNFIDGRIDGSGNVSFVSAVPEPSTLLLFGSGLVGLAAIIRRRIKK